MESVRDGCLTENEKSSVLSDLEECDHVFGSSSNDPDNEIVLVVLVVVLLVRSSPGGLDIRMVR